MGRVEILITPKKIEMERLLSLIPSEEHGAINHFVGVVRSRNQGRPVVAIEYDCFIPLCRKVLSEIAEEAQGKWGQANILIIHRHGRLRVGEPAVLIAASTGHRDESYRITRYIIEEIKKRAPIWKKEFYQDGETDWVRGHTLCQKEGGNHEQHRDHSCGR